MLKGGTNVFGFANNAHSWCDPFGLAKIHAGRQGKHQPGHNNFDPNKGRSELTHADPQALLDAGQGRGVMFGNKEVVDFGVVIGVHVDLATGARTCTTKGTIHYDSEAMADPTKGHAHIVPARP